MVYTTLVATTRLEENLTDPDWALFDCRFSLGDTESGRKDYAVAHIPGARYLHLDQDLSGPIVAGVTGRHPLPDVQAFSERLGQWGIDREVQVVVYDDMGGAIAARFWWMLGWLGHDAVAVLDGGWPAWQREGRPLGRDAETRTARVFTASPRAHLIANTEEVMARRMDAGYLILDARAADRYRGENENIDPVAGHIPGGLNAPFSENLNDMDCFREAGHLKKRFELLLEGLPANHAIIYCGSGVTAAHNLLAMAHAGLGDGRLYPGSWSEWILGPKNPVVTGPSVFGEDS